MRGSPAVAAAIVLQPSQGVWTIGGKSACMRTPFPMTVKLGSGLFGSGMMNFGFASPPMPSAAAGFAGDDTDGGESDFDSALVVVFVVVVVVVVVVAVVTD